MRRSLSGNVLHVFTLVSRNQIDIILENNVSKLRIYNGLQCLFDFILGEFLTILYQERFEFIYFKVSFLINIQCLGERVSDYVDMRDAALNTYG